MRLFKTPRASVAQSCPGAGPSRLHRSLFSHAGVRGALCTGGSFPRCRAGRRPRALGIRLRAQHCHRYPEHALRTFTHCCSGWRHEDLSEKAREVQRLGSEFYSRLGTLNEHYNKVGRSLEKAVEAYNSSLGSLDSRVGVTARRLYELEVPARTDRRPVEPQPVQAEPRRPRFED